MFDGDPITPITIVDVEVDLDQELAELTAGIKAHPGQFVLILQRTITTEPGPGGCFAPDTYHQRVVQRTLGVLAETGPDFRLSADSESLPTERFYIDPGSSYRDGSVEDGEWAYRYFYVTRHGPSLGMNTPLSLGLATAPNWQLLGYGTDVYNHERALEVVVGDAAVEEWFRSDLPAIICPEKSMLWLQEAAELIGRPMAEAPELDKKRQHERVSVIKSIWKLNDEAAAHRLRLESLRASRHGSHIHSEGGALTVIEDDYDLRVVSMGSNGQLDRISSRMASLITRARELGLGEHPYVVAFAMFYQVE